MNRSAVEQIADAVLYEGHILYPYRPSLKNRQRWTFGGLYARAYSDAHSGTDAWSLQTECLIEGGPAAAVDVKVRFLHLMDRTVGELASPLSEWPADAEPVFRPVESLQVGETWYQSWQEATACEVVLGRSCIGELMDRPRHREFSFPAKRHLEPLRDAAGQVAGVLARRQEPVAGSVTLSAQRVADDLFRVTVQVANRTERPEAANAPRDEALLGALVSTHTILNVQDGKFLSLIDPPERWQAEAAACRNVGAWPVLAGEEGDRGTMLSAPIILYDYPQIAPESQGDLFDGTEIDEILSLRILTLTDDEKRAVTGIDPRAGALLARTEALAREQLMGLHGTMRGLRPQSTTGEGT